MVVGTHQNVWDCLAQVPDEDVPYMGDGHGPAYDYTGASGSEDEEDSLMHRLREELSAATEAGTAPPRSSSSSTYANKPCAAGGCHTVHGSDHTHSSTHTDQPGTQLPLCVFKGACVNASKGMRHATCMYKRNRSEVQCDAHKRMLLAHLTGQKPKLNNAVIDGMVATDEDETTVFESILKTWRP